MQLTPEEMELLKIGLNALLALSATAYVAVKGGHWWLYQRNGNSSDAKQVQLLDRIAHGVEAHHADSQARNERLVKTLDCLSKRQEDCHTMLVRLDERKK